MVYRCVVQGCRSFSHERPASVHKFPASWDTKRRESWVHFVSRTRAEWTLTASCHVCAEHFGTQDFCNKRQYDMGLAKFLVLKSTAVPTKYPESAAPILQPEAQSSATAPVGSAEVPQRQLEVERIIRGSETAGDDEAMVDRSDGIRSGMSRPIMKDASTQYDPPKMKQRSQTRSVSCQVVPKPVKKMCRITQTDPSVTGLSGIPAVLPPPKQMSTPKKTPRKESPKKRKIDESFLESDSESDSDSDSDISYVPSNMDESDVSEFDVSHTGRYSG